MQSFKQARGYTLVIRVFVQMRTRPNLEVAGHAVCQFLGKLCDLVVQIDGGGVLQQVCLVHNSLHHLGVAMSHADSHDARECLGS